MRANYHLINDRCAVVLLRTARLRHHGHGYGVNGLPSLALTWLDEVLEACRRWVVRLRLLVWTAVAGTSASLARDGSIGSHP
jgi:hypothetical protein